MGHTETEMKQVPAQIPRAEGDAGTDQGHCLIHIGAPPLWGLLFARVLALTILPALSSRGSLDDDVRARVPHLRRLLAVPAKR